MTARTRFDNERSMTLSTDEKYAILSNRRRRIAIRTLHNNQGRLAVRELAEVIVADEKDMDPSQVSYEEQRGVYHTLIRTHLPRLEKAGLVNYDPDENTISPGEQLDEMARILESRENKTIVWSLESRGAKRISWSSYYLLLSILWLGIVTASGIGIFPFSALQPLGWGVVFVFITSLSSIVYMNSTEKY